MLEVAGMWPAPKKSFCCSHFDLGCMAKPTEPYAARLSQTDPKRVAQDHRGAGLTNILWFFFPGACAGKPQLGVVQLKKEEQRSNSGQLAETFPRVLTGP